MALARIDEIKLDYEDGKMARADFLEKAFELLRYRGTQAQFINAWQGIFTLNEPMADLVAELAKTRPLYLLSDTITCMSRRYFAISSFSRTSAAPLTATSHGLEATIGASTRSRAGSTDLVPAETFFVDDLAANISAARELGFQTHHYHPDRHGELLARLGALAQDGHR